jgi:hypothetical protein
MDYWRREIVDTLFGIIPPNFAPFHVGTRQPYAGLLAYHRAGLALIARLRFRDATR